MRNVEKFEANEYLQRMKKKKKRPQIHENNFAFALKNTEHVIVLASYVCVSVRTSRENFAQRKNKK